VCIPRKVYAIQHKKTKRIYIGSSKNPEERWSNHLCRLRLGKHCVEEMQNDFDRYGEDYSFLILDEITSFEDRKKEYEWMKKYNSTNRKFGYNYKDKERQHSREHPGAEIRAIEEKKFCIKAITDMLSRSDDMSLLRLCYSWLTKECEMDKGGK
jgi:hypothetical protein